MNIVAMTRSVALRLTALLILQGMRFAVAASPLAARGFAVVPEPQHVELGVGTVGIAANPVIVWGEGIESTDPAIEILTDRFGVSRRGPQSGAAPMIRLEVSPGAVKPGESLDRDRTSIEADAYRLEIAPGRIRIVANAAAGLFYGATAVTQLARNSLDPGERFRLPEGVITDWPELHCRYIYWDDAHHLERFDDLKRAIRTAASFRINGVVLKLEGHFQFQSAPAVVEPQALSPVQYQELTNYALRYHVQLIPYLDAPAHIAFLLKHPSLARLREYPDNNYEFCVTNPDSYKLLYGLFDDLLRANNGVRSFFLSTDESYYVGQAANAQCNEAAEAAKLGSRGKLLAEFLSKAGGYLNGKGRTVFFWGESPLAKADIPVLPRFLVNAEVNGPDIDREYRELGMRQLIYTSIEGEEKLFPDYFLLPSAGRLHAAQTGGAELEGRVIEAYRKIAEDPARSNADLMGAIVAGWADMGLHTETFWLGYAAGTAATWNSHSDPRELTDAFYADFYGENTLRMDRVYQLLSYQARFWNDSWETGPSTARKPILGYSEGIFPQPRPGRDQYINLPAIPSAEALSVAAPTADQRRSDLVSAYRAQNDELIGLLYENLRRAERHRYNLEVFLTIANICRQNLDLLQNLDQVTADFAVAAARSKAGDHKEAIARIDNALDLVVQIRNARNRVLHEAVQVWSESWQPKVTEANGRRFVHQLDDIKDHLPDRTVDMSYLVWRELILGIQPWFENVLAARNAYAAAHGLPSRKLDFEWKQF
jgi:hexosaminidase